ncbi:multiprotein-bridging factor 1 [Orbilia blumenaviensis]|uniref:Multiprotein-bridging factor 1 n=1 Tax=Orbilia blumenaviensis TaxID=1796055 RepID=A0AAV9U079_9PEZI
MSDWDTATVRIGIGSRSGGGPREKVARTQSEINAARRAGAVVSTDKKFSGGSNKSNTPEGQHLTKVDREDDVGKIAKVSVDVGKAMAAARQAKEPKMSQKDLATKINEKPSVINDYESGRAQPSQQVLAKLERALGVKLRGKDIGSPLGPKKGGESSK